MDGFDIACFMSMVRTKNFSVTAKELSLRQQTVSRTIQKLEEEIGYPLFMRFHHGICLTKAGENFEEWCLKTDSLMSHANQMYNSIGRRRPGLLRIGWCEWLGCPDWLKPLISTFRRIYPDIELEFCQGTPYTISTFLEQGYADVIFVPRTQSERISGAVTSSTLLKEQFFVAIASDHPMAAPGTPFSSIMCLPYLITYLADESKEEVIWQTRTFLCNLGFTPGQIIVLPNFDTVLMNVALRNGIFFMMRNDKSRFSDRIVLQPIDYWEDIVAVHIPGRADDNAALFVDFAVSRMGAKL